MDREAVRKELLGALARGYCSEKNSGKVLDADLIEAMVEEALPLFPEWGRAMVAEKDEPITIDERKRYNPDFLRGWNACRALTLSNMQKWEEGK